MMLSIALSHDMKTCNKRCLRLFVDVLQSENIDQEPEIEVISK